ncbi:transglycosylase SLT domain-containing protein [Palleronia rufa]|uniref:transglycosylase SLT domain-containing protein n=1 Tax=Palleronia rufa TaxID=1530186 RepID=UPI000562AB15|nr:transglycosylase SLT domain-containing protein [Palleronia rufa]
MGPVLSAFIAALFLALPAAANPADLCLSAANRASQESGVPYDVLAAISLTETGRTRQGRMDPWPWTVNLEGKGYWFDTQAEAEGFADQSYRSGYRSFDIGCFQINYRWHGEQFRSIAEMFDPLSNARYAARFLSELFAEYGDWTRAAGAFHSRNEEFAGRYRARFTQLRNGLDGSAPEDVVVAMAEPARRSSTYVFMSGGTPGGLGSLVPRGQSARPLFEIVSR